MGDVVVIALGAVGGLAAVVVAMALGHRSARRRWEKHLHRPFW